jgi:hypothetical protein
MTTQGRLESWLWLLGGPIALACCLSNQVIAQAGDNAVCNSMADCSSRKASPAFIDASVFSGGSDVCAQIRFAFAQLPAGGVIDARGVKIGTGNIFTCTGTPWFDGIPRVSAEMAAPLTVAGVVFQVPALPKGWKETVLHNFYSGPVDGAEPTANVIRDKAGHLHGTTSYGGSGFGVVFEVSP